MSDIKEIPLLSEHAAILGKCRSAFYHAVKAKFNSTSIFHNVEEAVSFVSNTSDLPADKRFSTKLSSGVEVSVWKDDLTRHRVDAVVNAANENLNHGGGLAQALSKVGGPMIQKWSDDIVEKSGKVPVGGVVLSNAGDLPCKFIIHAVGPCVPPKATKREIECATPFLHNAIVRVLEMAVHRNISSVAIPALSSGLFNFPRALCADIIVNAIKQFQEYGEFQGKNLEIRLVNNDEPSVQEMERATRSILGQSSISASYSGAVQGRNQSMTFSSSNSLRSGDVTLHLKMGLIEEEQVRPVVSYT